MMEVVKGMIVMENSKIRFCQWILVLWILSLPFHASAQWGYHTVDDWVKQGDTNYYRIKNYDQALFAYRKALEINPLLSEMRIYHNIGYIFSLKGEHQQAILYYSRAIFLKENYALAYYNRGCIYKILREYDKAIGDFSKAIEYNPDEAEAYNNRGAMYAVGRQIDSAIADFTKAIELKPNEARYYINRASSYSDKSEYDKGIEDCTRAIELDPNRYEDAYSNRGRIYSSKGKFDLNEYFHALADFDKALEIDLNSSGAWLGKGNAHAELGQIDEAIKAFEKYLEKPSPGEQDMVEKIREIIAQMRIQHR